MPTIPILRPGEVIKTFERLGWRIVRQRGSHIIMHKQGHIETLSVPNHRTVARGTLRGLIVKAGITIDEFIKALK